MRISTAITLMLFAVGGCGNKSSVSHDAANRTGPPPSASQAAPARGLVQNASAPASSFWSAQKLIRTANARIQVRDVSVALRVTDSIARANEGLLADSHTSEDAEGKKTADVVLRIPTQHFSTVLQALRGLGSVRDEAVATQDVTKDYADLETRLAVKEQTVNRLRALLQNSSAKLADVLEVEETLSRAVTELEQLKGERRFYDQQIALSTVKVVFFESAPTRVNQLAGPVSDALHNSLSVLGSSVGTVIYLLVAIMPWALVTLAVIWAFKLLRPRFAGPSRSIGARSPPSPPAT